MSGSDKQDAANIVTSTTPNTTLGVVFDFSEGNQPVPPDLTHLFTRTFEDISMPGNGWNGAERVAVANIARAGPVPGAADLLPNAAVGAATLITDRHATATEERVRETVSAIGDTRYAELVGILAATKAVDTITVLLGHDFETLPEPQSGDTIPDQANPRLKRRSAWVAMDGPSLPRHALSAAPGTQATVTRLLDRLYLSADNLGSNDSVRGLTREQMEIVILKVSHSNECFW